ncbi:MAG: hypothetical protein FJY95_21575 [Candidatus Handelsmanbacteria bacterium]|nr:hypothetical protein [Candidatus Handelsmanbacteria bacterium]
MDQVRSANFDALGLVGGQGSGGEAIALAWSAEGSPGPAIPLEPGLAAMGLAGSRGVEDKIDLALEMLDVNSTNTGWYRAMVVQDPADRQHLKGFFCLVHVVSAMAVA